MKIYLDHDWQGNMSSPRKILGEKTKLHLFFSSLSYGLLRDLLVMNLGGLMSQQLSVRF